MSLIAIAGKCQLTTGSLIELINKQVPVGAGRLGVTRNSLQEFVDGGTSIGLAGHLGITSASLQELRNGIGADGAVGLIIGLLANLK